MKMNVLKVQSSGMETVAQDAVVVKSVLDPVKSWASYRPDSALRVDITLINDEDVIRELGRVESYQVALQNLDYIRSIVVACQYQIPQHLVGQDACPELIAMFERAVARVVLKHPHMAVGLTNEHSDRPSWNRLSSLNFSHHIEWCFLSRDSDKFQDELEQITYAQLDSRFIDQPSAPGWKIKVLHQEGQDSIEVLFVFSHVNVDAGGAQLVHLDILQSLHDDRELPQNLSLARHILTLSDDFTSKLEPPPEAMLDFPVDDNLMLKFLQSEFQTPAEHYPRTSTQAHWAPITPLPFKTQYRCLTIPKPQVQELVRVCHLHQVTVTSLFHVLVLLSLTPLLKTSEASAFASMTAMDIRRFLPSNHAVYEWFNPARAVSNYVTILGHMFDEKLVALVRFCLSTDDSLDAKPKELADLIWATAKAVRQDIRTKLDQGVNNDMIGFSQATKNWNSQLTEHARRPRQASWVITNLGVIDGRPDTRHDTSNPVTATEPEWCIKQARFIMSANVVSAALSIAMMTIRDGDLSVSCSWQDCVLDGDMGEAFMTNLARWSSLVASLPIEGS